ncbi:MAG: hypothetical protein Q8P41_01690 [Pseudomonadota bacterium]|nr:hypothetical protein [Pseudomonadota bacterium]
MLGWLLACAPGPFTAEEADVVYDALSTVNDDAYASIYDFSAPEDDEAAGGAAAKGLFWHTAEDGGTFNGTVEGPGSWTGTVEVDGDYNVLRDDASVWSVVWSLDATYVDVAYGALRLDGKVRWNIQANATGSTFTHTSTVRGDIVGHGLALGEGPVEYETTVSLAGGRYQVQTTGSVGGHDISTSYDATAFGL